MSIENLKTQCNCSNCVTTLLNNILRFQGFQLHFYSSCKICIDKFLTYYTVFSYNTVVHKHDIKRAVAVCMISGSCVNSNKYSDNNNLNYQFLIVFPNRSHVST